VDLYAVIVTYRRPLELQTALQALRGQTRPPAAIIVVDNDPGALVERTLGPDITLLCPGDNLGPAGGIALGMTHVLSRASDEDWIVLVDDDDPPPDDDVIEQLLACAERASPGGASTVSAVGMVGTRFDRRRGRPERVPDRDLEAAVVDVDWIAGNQLPIYAVQAVRRHGVFDPTLFFGFEELEYGLRLRAAGERLVVPGAMALSRREQRGRVGLGPRVPSKGGMAWRRYYSARNLLLITRRYAGRRAGARALARSALAGPVRSLVLLRRPDLARASLRGSLDALRGRTGRTIEPEGVGGQAGGTGR
jgi:rhamnopyranosyl-N-acetylglucosaminyl-diphospho-decaprenol beta-1,3/1,4-galactofuranosyltransferase